MSVTLYTPHSSKIIHEAKVDFRQRVIQPVIHIVQYDKSLPIVAVTLYNNGVKYALPNDADVSIRWGKRDHTFVYNPVLGCNADRTVVYFEITYQMTVFYGEHNPIIELRNGESVAGSCSMPFYLDRNPIQEKDVESSVESGVIEELLKNLDFSNIKKDVVLKPIDMAVEYGQKYDSHSIVLKGDSWEFAENENFGYVQSSDPILSTPHDLFFSSDGLKLFVLDSNHKPDGVTTQRGIYQYNLSSPFDIMSRSDIQEEYIISAYDNTIPYGLFFKPNGLSLYYVGSTSRKVFQVNLTIAWDLSSASTRKESPQLVNKTYQDIHISSDGKKAFITESSDDIIRVYNIGKAWDISTMSATNSQRINIKNDEPDPYALVFSPDGTKMILIGKTSGNMIEYILNPAWSTDVVKTGHTLALVQAISTGIRFNNTGDRIFIIGTTTRRIDEFALDIPYSLQGLPGTSKEREESFYLRTETEPGLDLGKLVLSYQKDDGPKEDILKIDKFGNIEDYTRKAYVDNKIDNAYIHLASKDFVNAALSKIDTKIDNLTVDWLRYVRPSDDDFGDTSDDNDTLFMYIGTDEYIIIPTTVFGHKLYSLKSSEYTSMFDNVNTIKGVGGGSHILDYSFAFAHWRSLKLDISRLQTQNAILMSSMFLVSEATTLDLSSFDTSSVTDMSSMFESSEATTLDLSSFDTSSVTDMSRMFMGSQATTLDLSSFDTSSVTNMSRMFMGSQATTLDLSGFDTSSVTDMSSMFESSEATTLDLSSFDTSSVTDMSYMFYTSEATTLDLSGFDTSSVTDMSYMFYTSEATTLDLSGFDTSSVTNMSSMFESSEATTLDLSSFDTSSVTDMSYMFYTSEATTLDLSSFDTSSVTDMSYMFYTSEATTLDLSSFDTSSVTNMSYMFCFSQATTLDLSSFDTSSVTNMSGMFSWSRATTLDLSSFTHENIIDKGDMFKTIKNCTVYFRNQEELNFFTTGTNWDSSNTALIKGA